MVENFGFQLFNYSRDLSLNQEIPYHLLNANDFLKLNIVAST